MFEQMESNLLNVSFLENHFLKDAGLLEEVLQNYKKTYSGALSEMRQALAAENDLSLANALHKLRGSTLNFVQGSFVDELSALEQKIRDQLPTSFQSQDIDLIEGHLLKLTSQLSTLAQKWKTRVDH